MAAAAPSRSAEALAIGLVLAVTAARVLSLAFNRTDLYFDEAQYWVWSTTPDWGYYSKPPLIAWIIALTTGLFGTEEWAVRLAAPLFHGATALVLLALGRRLYGGSVGALAAALYLTLPAVSLSSTLISTDVPLLFFWALGLLAAVHLLETDRWPAALAFGAAVAVGLNAKYAMAFLPALLVIHVALTPGRRGLFRSPRLWGAVLIGLVGLVPNLVWNVQHQFVTLLHTRDNANWSGSLFHPASLLEFVGAQFGVFGPILLVLLLLATAGRLRSASPMTDRRLIHFSVPVLLVMTVQALLSRSNANWAATAYPAATVLVAALFASGRLRPAWLTATGALHGLAALVLLLAPPFAPDLTVPGGRRPFERVLGWSDYARAVADAAERTGARTIVVDRRSDAAALLYYLRDSGLAIAVIDDPDAPPQDHFEMTRPLTPAAASPGLLVAPKDDAPPLPGFATVTGQPMDLPVSPGVQRGGSMTVRVVAW